MIKEMHSMEQERRYKDNKSEENLKVLKLMGKEYNTIINKCNAVHKQNCL